MTLMYELVLVDGHVQDTHLFNPLKGFQVFKRKEYVEVVYRNEETREYSATAYPWHRIARLTTHGVLERPGN